MIDIKHAHLIKKIFRHGFVTFAGYDEYTEGTHKFKEENTMKTRKKYLSGVLALALVLGGTAWIAGDVEAAGNGQQARAVNFGDADGDGVCDNCNQTGQGMRNGAFVDADGDGVCDNMGSGMRQNFVDENNDGINDNAGRGQGQGMRSGAFIDADGDGVCDNVGTGMRQNFVDADGDGINDNAGKGKMQGKGGFGQGRATA